MDRTAQLTARSTPYETAYDPPATATTPATTTSLRTRAARVLEANWTGASTVPSRDLYPHQWSWDSAFIAIGLRHVSPLRAQTELETLFAAQWADGRVPHIVFNPSVPLDAYFPSPDFWRSSTAGRTAGAPRTLQTSGIVQPPVHALAAWLVHRADPELSRARGFLARLHPRLAAWHRYLLHRRDLGGAGLVSVVHPWEQGMDNSPCWDAPLARITPAPARSFRRADLDHGAAEDRPTDLDYGRYVRLAADYRDAGYADGGGKFAVEDPAFNALLIASELALARIAEELGATGSARRARAQRLTATLVERLWDAEAGMFLCRDLRDEDAVSGRGAFDAGHGASDARRGPSGAGPAPEHGTREPSPVREHGTPRSDAGAGPRAPGSRLLPERAVSGLVPLILPGLPRDIAVTLVRTLRGPHFSVGDRTRLVPSYDLLGEAFDPHRYWRGPAWFNTSWLLERGLRAHGETAAAGALRQAVLDLAGATDFAEYVDPYTGAPCGAPGFGWTAALALDLCHRPAARHERQHLDKSAQRVVPPTHTGTFDRSDRGGDRG
ncbi:hypothetical protein C3492_06835 [Streptomyces sp. Ru62]|uniref:MGH1-like glycoside hydrolase domain-containing protein n=1 Tax=Streptomyces sp. Ru62 TaxID=2080745 RepID=UPI000CDD75D2|nr:hypothetical protein [Streptomyces sp. Ru62]POX64097.1 hypothetical protein C3492_06835 [Streptomyces sp. Ru62]